jgi:hypothetical protein
LPIDRFAKPLEYGPSFAVPPPRVLGPPRDLGARCREFAIELVRAVPRRVHLPPVKRDAGERGEKDHHFERLQHERHATQKLDGEIRRHERGDDGEQDRRSAPAPTIGSDRVV